MRRGFLIRSIASHFVEWGVKEFSWHQLFSSDSALFREATAQSTYSVTDAINGGVIRVHKDRARRNCIWQVVGV